LNLKITSESNQLIYAHYVCQKVYNLTEFMNMKMNKEGVRWNCDYNV